MGTSGVGSTKETSFCFPLCGSGEWFLAGGTELSGLHEIGGKRQEVQKTTLTFPTSAVDYRSAADHGRAPSTFTNLLTFGSDPPSSFAHHGATSYHQPTSTTADRLIAPRTR